jgi:hypothetical protein
MRNWGYNSSKGAVEDGWKQRVEFGSLSAGALAESPHFATYRAPKRFGVVLRAIATWERMAITVLCGTVGLVLCVVLNEFSGKAIGASTR